MKYILKTIVAGIIAVSVLIKLMPLPVGSFSDLVSQMIMFIIAFLILLETHNELENSMLELEND